MPICRKTTQLHCLQRSRFTRFSRGLMAAWALPLAAVAADNPGAHQHGQARLQMALENDQIDLMFISPAYNLAGFEHQARTEQQRQRLTEIRQWLETTPLINTDAGHCRVRSASVELGGKDEHGTHEHGQHEHGHHDGDQASHRDYQVSQQLSCEGITGDSAFSSVLPDRFPELEALTVEWVGPAGQGKAQLSSSAQTLSLTD